MDLSSKKSRITNLLINFFYQIPKIRNKIYRFYAWKIFEFVPFLKKTLYKFYDKFWYFELSAKNNQFNLSKYQKHTYNIDIERLQFSIDSIKFSNKENLDSDEDWDLLHNLIILSDTPEYKLIEAHFLKNKEWQNIEEFSLFVKKLSKGQLIHGCSNEEELLLFLNSLDQTFLNFNELKFEKIKNEIEAGIGRNGEYIIFNGIFYITLLKILKITTIPVKIIKRHSKWIKFSNNFLKFQFIHGGIYQPLIHPDLSLKSSYSDERFNIIKQNLSIHKGSLLDIGANLGYFCHKFEDLGFNCYAVEIRPSNVYFMKSLRDIEDKKFKIINKSIFDLKKRLDFDIVLALNIFHHFLREKELYLNLIKFLKKIRTKVMFFQPHDPNEKIMENAYINYNNQQFVDFILKNSGLNNFKILNNEVDGRNRPIYKLST